jgi:glutamine phosphoribosylpyrophosphate amidotransferase
MCGIVGYFPVHPELGVMQAFRRLFEESTVRGLHAFGLAQVRDGRIFPIRTHQMDQVPDAFDPSKPAIAHTRYSQSGDWRVLENNQPLVAAGYALAFNGVIHQGIKEEFEAEYDVKCDVDNDGEVFLRCLEKGEKAEEFLYRIPGSFAGVWLDSQGRLWAGCNARRPLWRKEHLGAIWYASTRDIFVRAGFPEPEPVRVGTVATLEMWE